MSLSWGRRRAVWPVGAGCWMAAALLLAGCGGGGGDAAAPGAGTQAVGAANASDASIAADLETAAAVNLPDIVVDDTGSAVLQLGVGPAVVWSGSASDAEEGGMPGPESRRYGVDVCQCSAVSDATNS